MNAFVLGTFTSSEKIKVFQYTMFHGQYDPGQNPLASFDIAATRSPPCLITREGTTIPDVFKPRNSLVVNAKVAEKVAAFPNVRLRAVVFSKLFECRYRAGDFSFFDEYPPRYSSHPDKLIDRLPDVQELHESAGKYYELVLPRLQDVPNGYQDTKKLMIKTPGSAIDEELVYLSASLLQDYPAVWKAYLIFSDDFFHALEPHIDWDYFAVVRIEV